MVRVPRRLRKDFSRPEGEALPPDNVVSLCLPARAVIRTRAHPGHQLLCSAGSCLAHPSSGRGRSHCEERESFIITVPRTSSCSREAGVRRWADGFSPQAEFPC